MKSILRLPLLPAVLLLLLCAGAALGERPSRGIDPKLIVEEFDVPRDGDLLLLPVELKGKKYLFALDTGSSITVVDSSLWRLLGAYQETSEGDTNGESVEIFLYKAPRGSLGKIPLRLGAQVAVADMSEFREVSGSPVYGFLGMDFLRRHVIQIDVDRGKVNFLRRLQLNPGKPVRIHAYQNEIPVVAARLAGCEELASFQVDTGAIGPCAGSLRKDLFDKLSRMNKLKQGGNYERVSLAGKGPVVEGEVNSLSVGKFNHEKVRFDSPASHNALGLGYWSRYVVTFDFPDRWIYLKKGAQFNRADDWRNTGLYLLRRNRQTIIDSVTKGSRWAESGIRPHDELLRVGALKVSSCSHFAVHRYLSLQRKPFRVRIKRGGKELDVSITPK